MLVFRILRAERSFVLVVYIYMVDLVLVRYSGGCKKKQKTHRPKTDNDFGPEVQI